MILSTGQNRSSLAESLRRARRLALINLLPTIIIFSGLFIHFTHDVMEHQKYGRAILAVLMLCHSASLFMIYFYKDKEFPYMFFLFSSLGFVIVKITIIIIYAPPSEIPDGISESIIWMYGILVYLLLNSLTPFYWKLTRYFLGLFALLCRIYVMKWHADPEITTATLALFRVNLIAWIIFSGSRTYLIQRENHLSQIVQISALEKLVYIDFLTGLPNHHHFNNYLAERILANPDRPFQVLFIDLDSFKTINDTLGHAQGDIILQQMGRFLCEASGDGAFVSRLHGDEFSIVLEESSSVSSEQLSLNLLEIIRTTGIWVSPEFNYSFLTLSIGISSYPKDAQTPEDLLRHADSAMLAVKRSGKHGFKHYNSTDDAVTEYQQLLAHELAGALERQEISLVFQPIYQLSTAKIVKVEALLRWTHPKLGAIPPSDFIPVAEHSGLILGLGQWVIQQACLSASSWEEIQVCVNLSALQLLQHSFLEDLKEEIQKNGLIPTRLALEITETMLMQDSPHTDYILDALKSLGIDLIIDDFGIGYSNFNRLRTLPVQALKIDQSFTFNIVGHSAEHLYVQQIVRSTLDLSQIADLQVTAEGIETTEQLAMVQSLGCHYGQGYLFSRPCSAEQIDALLAQSELPAWFRPPTAHVPPT